MSKNPWQGERYKPLPPGDYGDGMPDGATDSPDPKTKGVDSIPSDTRRRLDQLDTGL